MTLFSIYLDESDSEGAWQEPWETCANREGNFSDYFLLWLWQFQLSAFFFALYYFFLFKQGVKKKRGQGKEQKEKVSCIVFQMSTLFCHNIWQVFIFVLF